MFDFIKLLPTIAFIIIALTIFIVLVVLKILNLTELKWYLVILIPFATGVILKIIEIFLRGLKGE